MGFFPSVLMQKASAAVPRSISSLNDDENISSFGLCYKNMLLNEELPPIPCRPHQGVNEEGKPASPSNSLAAMSRSDKQEKSTEPVSIH